MTHRRGRYVPIVEVLGATIGFPDEMPLDQIQGVISEKVNNVKAFSNFVSRPDYHPGLSWEQIKEMGLSDLDLAAIMTSPVPVLGGVTDVLALADHERRGDDVAWWEWALSGVGLGVEAGAASAIFAGIKAANGNTKALGTAKDMAMDGLSRDEIWKKTGWFEDVDGHWKFEINDQGLSLKPSGDRGLSPAGGPSDIPLDINKHLTHDELLKQYPDISEGGLTYQNNVSESGSYTKPGRFGERYTISAAENVHGKHDSFKGEVDYGDPSFANPEGTRSVMAHELQHGVQQREGFGLGGNPDEFHAPKDAALARVRFLNQELSSLAKEMDKVDGKAYDSLKSQYDAAMSEKLSIWDETTKNPYQQYLRLSGEAESRNVQTRIDMTDAERRAKPPWTTLDVPESELTVKKQ